jgi:hypothetical protein
MRDSSQQSRLCSGHCPRFRASGNNAAVWRFSTAAFWRCKKKETTQPAREGWEIPGWFRRWWRERTRSPRQKETLDSTKKKHYNLLEILGRTQLVSEVVP